MSHIRQLFFVFILTFIFAVFLCDVDAKTGPSHGKAVVCYVATWAVYRKGSGSFALENLDPNLCTHIVYAFAGLNVTHDSIRSLDPWQDLKDDYGKGGYERLTGLRSRAPHLKVTLAIGGWGEGSANYSRLVADPNRRKNFVRSAVNFIRQYKFDGLDLDWEFPGKRGGAPQDKQNFVLLVKELREEFDKHGLLLTAALGASAETITLAYDVRALSKLLDFFHLMCYDYHGSWDQKVGSNAPLRGYDLSVENTVNFMLQQGAPANKLVVGLPFYGRTFIIEDVPTRSPMGLPAKPAGFKGPLTKEDGFMGYNEICTSLNNMTAGWQKSWDVEAAQAVAWREDPDTPGNSHVVTFDSTRSIANKMRYAMQNDLGGAMVWSVDTDDFLGNCNSETDTYEDFAVDKGLAIPPKTHKNYPLLRTINEAIVVALNEIIIIKQNEIDKENEIPHGDKGSAHVFIPGFMCLVSALLINIL